MSKYGKKAGEKVERAMRERKRGTLKSGRSGRRVTSRKQAIAIGLSEARRSGAKVPKRKGSRKASSKKRSVSFVTIGAPDGTWTSRISATTVAEQGLRLGFVAFDGGDIYWLEGRPQEGGRNVLVRRSADGTVVDLTPPDHNVRSRVHEYGGGAYVVSHGVVYYSNFADQRIYRTSVTSGTSLQGSSCSDPITPEGKWFYADATVDERRRRLICVREDHTHAAHEPVNTLVSIPLDGDPDAGHVIASGYDFYSTPRLNHDGSRLCWLSWRHPQMPWDGTELWVATISDGGLLENLELVAGGPHESIFQPGWSPGGTLCFVSDRTGWWSLYSCDVRHETF